MGKVTGTYSGIHGDGMSFKEAMEKKAGVERLNATVGARGRELEIKPMPGNEGKFYVEERFKKWCKSIPQVFYLRDFSISII